jgi:hypothetical protein
VPASFPTARLQAILGVPLGAVDRPALQRLVDAGVEEEFDLEFHGTLYAPIEKDRHELAKDIAAMTERGGLIVLGLAEKAAEMPMRLVDVDLDDSVATAMRQVIAARVFPMPEFELQRVPPGQWLIVVPPSPLLPHAVSVPGKDGLHYFTRHGSTTRPLSESEIADRYRRRFQEAAERASQVSNVFKEGAARLKLAGATWLAMALVPDRPGQVEISRAELERHRRWAEGWQPSAPQSRIDLLATRAQTVGFRRLIVSRQYQYHGVSEWEHCEVHPDGSSFLAVVIGQPPDQGTNDQLGNIVIPERDHVIDQGELGHAVIASLSMLSSQCVHFAGASGDATLISALISGGDADGRIDVRPLHLIEQTIVGPLRLPGSRPVNPPSRSRRTIPLTAVATNPQELIATAHGVIGDILSEFGQGAWEGTDVTGALNPAGFGQRDAQLVEQWGRAVGLL